MKRFMFTLMAALFVITAPTAAQAQFAATVAPSNSGNTYYSNQSQDGTNCNIGFVVAGIAGNANNRCNSQRPNGWLPFDDVNLVNPEFARTSAGNPLFTSVDTIKVTVFGDIAGQNGTWGWFDNSGFFTLNGLLPTASAPATTTFTTTSPWGLYIDLTDGTRALSTGDQFAFFGYSNVAGDVSSGLAGGRLLGGIEDINVSQGGGSDRDFNDVVLLLETQSGGDLSTVPEPSTYALMGAGLLGLGFVSRRRKQLTA